MTNNIDENAFGYVGTCDALLGLASGAFERQDVACVSMLLDSEFVTDDLSNEGRING